MQRFTVEALDGLGPEFLPARTAVIEELSWLLQRVPKLPTLTFSDGTRFADPATAAWIDEAVAGSQSPAESRVQNAATTDVEIEALLEKARQIFAAGDLAGAVALLSSPQGGER